jgi:TolC family type I secretion outer membrane protein
MTPGAQATGRIARRFVRGFAVAAALVALSGAADAAESIASALASAYVGNPTLNAERARQRATDEQVPQALSGWRPTVTANGDAGVQWTDTNITNTARTNPAGFTIGLAQPVFRGFRTVASTRQAEANVAAGNQQLLAVEQQVLLDGATAFMDVIRDRSIVDLRQKNVATHVEDLKAAQARFSVGDITRTDVAQAEARLELARAELEVSRARLAASIAAFNRVIGHQPGALTYPPISRRVPKSLEEALKVAERVNPEILAASFTAQAAQENVKVVTGELLPTVQLEAFYRLRHDQSPTITTSEETGVLGTLSMPLYEAGNIYSQVRQAKQVASQRRIEIIEAGRAVRENVVRAWNNFVAAGETIVSLKAQVAANKLALEGVRQEALVGTRTTLDVLDAERELVNSQISLVTAERDRVVVAYQLVAATGQMTARALGLDVPVYDPDAYAASVRNKWFGTSTETVD